MLTLDSLQMKKGQDAYLLIDPLLAQGLVAN